MTSKVTAAAIMTTRKAASNLKKILFLTPCSLYRASLGGLEAITSAADGL
jgi:hypothetical protein